MKVQFSKARFLGITPSNQSTITLDDNSSSFNSVIIQGGNLNARARAEASLKRTTHARAVHTHRNVSWPRRRASNRHIQHCGFHHHATWPRWAGEKVHDKTRFALSIVDLMINRSLKSQTNRWTNRWTNGEIYESIYNPCLGIIDFLAWS